MIRYEYKTPYKGKGVVGCEDTLKKAKAHIAAIKRAGVVVIDVHYFDNDERIAQIRAGNF